MTQENKESERLKKQKRKNLFRLLEFAFIGIVIMSLFSMVIYEKVWKDYIGVEEISYGQFAKEFELVYDNMFGLGIANTEKVQAIERVDIRDDILVIFWKDKNISPIKVRIPLAYISASQFSDQFVQHGVAVKSKWAIGLDLFANIAGVTVAMLFFAFILFYLPKLTGGKSLLDFFKKKTKPSEGSSMTFDDVAGIDEAKQELVQTVEFLKNPEGFEALGAIVPKGILLLGPPGCGKTLLAKAVAGEAKVPFFSRSGSEFVEIITGVGPKKIRELFEEARKNAPCIVFIDEIDSVGRARGSGGPASGGEVERDNTLNQLNVEIDGFSPKLGIVVIAATNRPDLLDPGLVRPGRFDRKIVIPLPDVKGREAILQVHVRNKHLAENVDLKKIAQGTSGFSGADLADLANKAALRAARAIKDRPENQKGKILMEDLNYSRDKVLMGSERRNFFLSPKEKEHNAYYEAAKVIVAKSLPLADPVYKVSIVPKGLAMGKTQLLPEKDRYLISREHILTQIKILLAGRSIEKILNRESNRVVEDLQKATQLVTRMICEFGMDETLGPRSLGKKEELGYQGSEITRYHRDFSEDKAEIIDKRLNEILSGCLEEDTKILLEKKEVLDKLVRVLIEKEELEAEEIDEVLQS